MIYTVTLNPALDYVMQVSKLNRGETNRSFAEQLQFGGKGINVATVLSCLGQQVTALGFIAGFTGDALEQMVKKAGVQTAFIRLSAGQTRINVKLKGEQETEINAGGPPVDERALQQLCVQLQSLQNGDTLVLAGSIPASLPVDTYATLLKHLPKKDIRVVVDATGKALLSALPYGPFLVKPNRSELEELAGHPLSTQDALWEAAASLQQKGAKNVLVSLGGDGAVLLDETGKKYVLSAPLGTVKNAVGAGDSMVAGFLTGVKDGYANALKWGVAAGSATAFSMELATLQEIKRIGELL